VIEAAFLEVVVFELAGQLFGLPATDVRELIRACRWCRCRGRQPLSRASSTFVAHRAGSRHSRAFRLSAKEVEPTDHFLIAQAGERLVALHVDRATDLIRLPADALEPVAGLVSNAECVTWVAKAPNDLVLIHDLATFLSRAEAQSLDEALREKGGSSDLDPCRFEDLGYLLSRHAGLTFPVGRTGHANWASAAMSRAGVSDPVITGTGGVRSRRTGRSRRRSHRRRNLLFREKEQLEFIRHSVLAGLSPQTGGSSSVRAWSAGCASGEEAYSWHHLRGRGRR